MTYKVKTLRQILNSARTKQRVKRVKKLAVPIFFIACITGGVALGILLSNDLTANWNVTSEAPFVLAFVEDPGASPAYMGIWYNHTVIFNNTDIINAFDAWFRTVLTYPGVFNYGDPQVVMYRDGALMTFAEIAGEIQHEYSMGVIAPGEVVSFDLAYYIQEGSDTGAYAVTYVGLGDPV